MTNIDPITLEVQWNRLIAIMDEVDATVVRTSFSSIVGETRDFAVIMLDARGRSIAQSTFSSPAFTFTLPFTTKHFLRLFPPETLEEGDVLITNDPWLASGHLPDFTIVMPVFHAGRHVAFMATAAHIADIGGTLAWFEARDLFEEGLRIPPSKLYRAGKRNEDVHNFIAANVRVPDQVLGDVGAIRSAEMVGARRLAEFLGDYALGGLEPIADAVLQRTEEAMRESIRSIPDGECEGEVWADGFRDALHIKSRVTVRDDEIWIDYTGSSPQFAHGSINNAFNLTFADTANTLKCSLLPHVPNNEGLYPPIHVSAPEGSVLNCKFPVAVKSRSKTSFHIHNAIYAALVQLAPQIVQAGSGSFWAFTANGTWPDGRRFNVHVLPNGGKGALQNADGLPTIAFPYNGTVTPVEIVENTAPLLVEEKAFLMDSGGAGTFRGGLGQRYVMSVRSDLPVTVSIRPDKVRFPPPGLAGGAPGAIGTFSVNGKKIPLGTSVVTMGQGERLIFNLPGGGGFGDALERAPNQVLEDVKRGYVSKQVARDVYGVVLKGDPPAVDEDATRSLREELQNARKESPARPGLAGPRQGRDKR